MAERIVRSTVTVFDLGDLPPSGHGLTLYRGVLVCWDQDRDTRVLEMIDDMLREDREELVAVQESKGCLELVWRSCCPNPAYHEGSFVSVAGDSWSVYRSAPLSVPVAAAPDR